MTWYRICNPENVASPALLVYPERIRLNIQEMIRVAGSPDRLHPHIKTHKCREIVAMQQEAGINKFKCATIAEAEMLGECRVEEVLLAYQPTGPTITRLLELNKKYPGTKFSALVDNIKTAEALDNVAAEAGRTFSLYIDLDAGMHRTGIAPGPETKTLRAYLTGSNNLEFIGWHIYDGHIRQSDFEKRRQAVDQAFKAVKDLISGGSKERIIAGGSPTFPVHALNPEFDLSPGTSLLWDQGYSQVLPDQNFQVAAVLFTRVISKPGVDLLCLDLGHKALASEMPHPRVHFPDLGEVEFSGHSEEHLVVHTSRAKEFQVGDVLYAIPMHICPTTALHQELLVVDNSRVVDRWKVYARDRRITV
jgi:D-serine deaminase-like pyridoxal phosphate-dependent protein